MGFTPAQVRAMSLYEFSACVAGYVKANSAPEIEPPTAEEFESAKQMYG